MDASEEATVPELDIVRRAKIDNKVNWLCITGGEPAEHNCTELIKLAYEHDLFVSVETSGYGDMEQFQYVDQVVVSPKDLFHGSKVKGKADISYASELKCVVSSIDDILYYVKEYEDFNGPKAFQPVNNDNYLARLCLRYCGDTWKVRGQQHVLFGLR